MLSETLARKQEGIALLKDHLTKVSGEAELFLASLKGFRRDLMLAEQSVGDHLKSQFTGLTTLLAVPELAGGRSFADLCDFLGLAEDAIDGTITLKDPSNGPDLSARETLLEEISITHENLMDVSETGRHLYESLQTACLEFDIFNTKNIEVGDTEPNILFDRDALNASSALARALSERAIRLDIDLMERKYQIESGTEKMKV